MKSDNAMRKAYTYFLIAMSVMASSCSERLEQADDSALISLRAAIGEAAVSTRAVSKAEAFKGTVATEQNPLEAIVLFSTEAGVYRHAPAGPTYLPCHSKVTFTDDSYQYPEKYNGFNLKYPTDNATVYCVGMSPADGEWEISDDGRYARHHIDGNDDLMFAECREGSWSNHFEPHLYKHQLTWLKLCVYGTDSDVDAFWGSIESLTVESKDSLIISLSDGKASFSNTGDSICAFEGTHQLTATLHEIGSVFCAPALEYKITVKTRKAGERTIVIKLQDLGGDELTDPADAAGNLFVIELGFTPFAIIEGECVLNPWEYQDENLYLK